MVLFLYLKLPGVSGASSSFVCHLLNLPSTPAESGSQVRHSLSQQGVLASFGHPDLQKSSLFLRTKTFCEDLFLNINFKHINEFVHLNIIPMAVYLDIIL